MLTEFKSLLGKFILSSNNSYHMDHVTNYLLDITLEETTEVNGSIKNRKMRD